MSQRRITLPITIPDYKLHSARYLPVSQQAVLECPESAEYRWTPMGHMWTPLEHVSFGMVDAWELRTVFLECPVESWQGFLGLAGHFDTHPISQNGFEEWQRLLRTAMITPSKKWRLLEKKFDWQKVKHLLALVPRFEWDGESLTVKLGKSTALGIMIASIQLDALEGAEFRLCARHDCNAAPFRVENRLKEYCSYECAHLVAVRRSRERAAKTGKRKNRRGKSK
jgi:hypothetical protein